LDGLPNHDQPVIVKKMPTSSIKSWLFLIRKYSTFI
jgi:hypothetical protein